MACIVCHQPSRVLHVFGCGHGGCAACVLQFVEQEKNCSVCSAAITCVSPVWAAIADLGDGDRAVMAQLSFLVKSNSIQFPSMAIERHNQLAARQWRNEQIRMRDRQLLADFCELFQTNHSLGHDGRQDLKSMARRLVRSNVFAMGSVRRDCIGDLRSLFVDLRTGPVAKLAVILDARNIRHINPSDIDDPMCWRAIEGGVSLRDIPAFHRSSELCAFAIRTKTWNIAHVPLTRVNLGAIEFAYCLDLLPSSWINTGAMMTFLCRRPFVIDDVADQLHDGSWEVLLKTVRTLSFRIPQRILDDEEIMKAVCRVNFFWLSALPIDFAERIATPLLRENPERFFNIPADRRTPDLLRLISTLSA